MTSHAVYGASRISSNLKGSTKKAALNNSDPKAIRDGTECSRIVYWVRIWGVAHWLVVRRADLLEQRSGEPWQKRTFLPFPWSFTDPVPSGFHSRSSIATWTASLALAPKL